MEVKTLSLNVRNFKSIIDGEIAGLINEIRMNKNHWQARRDAVVSKIATHQTEFQQAYTVEERQELTNLNTTLQTIFDYIQTHLPELIT